MAAKKKKDTNPNEVHDLTKGKILTKELTVITDTFEELDEDIIQVRKATEKYNIVTRDPHGFSYIEGPGLPSELRSAYTTYALAARALDGYLKVK